MLRQTMPSKNVDNVFVSKNADKTVCSPEHPDQEAQIGHSYAYIQRGDKTANMCRNCFLVSDYQDAITRKLAV